MKTKQSCNKNQRKQHNLELIRRMRSGDSLCSYNSTDSWFPPRPMVKKDKDAMAKLYKQDIITLSEDEKNDKVVVFQKNKQDDDTLFEAS
jgi:hypothetical protein